MNQKECLEALKALESFESSKPSRAHYTEPSPPCLSAFSNLQQFDRGGFNDYPKFVPGTEKFVKEKGEKYDT